MNLNYKVLQEESSKMFRLIDAEQETLRRANITFSTVVSDETIRQLQNTAIKVVNKVPAEKLMSGAGALGAAFLANPALLVPVGVLAGGVVVADVYQRKKAAQEAKKALEQAFKCLVVYLEQMNELLNQRMIELNEVFSYNTQRRMELQSEISALTKQISEVQAFVSCVST